jgi:hypothetical protein
VVDLTERSMEVEVWSFNFNPHRRRRVLVTRSGSQNCGVGATESGKLRISISLISVLTRSVCFTDVFSKNMA